VEVSITGFAFFLPLMPFQDPTGSGRTRTYIQCDCATDQYNNSTSVGTTSHRRRLPSSYVHCFWVDRTIFESFREKQLPQYQMGALSNQGQRDISDTGKEARIHRRCWADFLLHPSFEGCWVVRLVGICTIEAVVDPYSVPTHSVFLARVLGEWRQRS
jgi:hypothetical protein